MRPRPSLITALGMLACLTGLCQLGPLWWPGGGYILAMAAVLPAAVASAMLPRRCTWFYLVTALLIGLFSPEEMLIYITATGPLGLMLGLTLRQPFWRAVPLSAAALTAGLLLMPALAGVMPWGGLERTWPHWVTGAAYGGFALIYTALLRLVFVRLWNRLVPHLPYQVY